MLLKQKSKNMSIRNSVTLIGNIGKEPEFKKLDNGQPLCTFSLATSEIYTNKKGEKITDTSWHNIVMWGKTAETAEKILHRAKEIALQGKLNYNKWQDKEGNTRYTPQIIANEFVITKWKESSAEPQQNGSGRQNATVTNSDHPSNSHENEFSGSNEGGDDLPF